ncbi:hypothetical protein U1Q18_041744, partial [Sarracenia purpurea var. burkii]
RNPRFGGSGLEESSHRKPFTEQHEEEKDCTEQVANLVACIPFASSSGFSPLAVDLRRTWPKAEVCSLPEASKRISVLGRVFGRSCRCLSHRSCRGDRKKQSRPTRPRRSSPSPSPVTILEDLGRSGLGFSDL